MKLKDIYDKLNWEKCQAARALVVIDIVGNIEPKKVTDKHVEKVTEHLEKKGLGDSTVNRYLASLSKILKHAHKRYDIYGMERMPHIEWNKELKAV